MFPWSKSVLNIVISQPMFFPWVGMFEQIKLADCYVHYPDVQFSKGSFVNRVQIKTANGIKWLTVPLKNVSMGQFIGEVEINDERDWRTSHLGVLSQSYRNAPYKEEMLDLVRCVYAENFSTIAELSIKTLEVVNDYYELTESTIFRDSRELKIDGFSSQRVLDIVKAMDGDVYITGHGAKKYLEHDLFEKIGVRVEYMEYEKKPYSQLHGDFTPYVSILDLIANVGLMGKDYIISGATHWRDCL